MESNPITCIKVGWNSEREALIAALGNNMYYARLISEGEIPGAIGAFWCDECKEWHIKHETLTPKKIKARKKGKEIRA